MSDSFQDLLQQISNEHHRVVHRLRADNEELRARLAKWESASAPGQLPDAAHGLGDDQLSLSRGNKTGSAKPTSTPCHDVAPALVVRNDLDAGEDAKTLGSSSQIVEAVPTETGKSNLGLRGKVQRVIRHDTFELVTAGIILLDAATMAVEQQYNGIEAGYQMGYRGMLQPADEVWPFLGNVLPVMEKAFTVIYCLELALRIFGTGRAYFLLLLNWIDIAVVTFAVLDWVFVAISSKWSLDISIIRLMRLLRLLKALRILTKFRGPLKLLMVSIFATWSTLFWALCLLVVIQTVSAMLMVQLLSEYIEDSTKPEIERHEIYKYWGTFSHAFITMFEITFANWSPPCRALVTHVHQGYFLFFMVYRCVIGLALLSVINAVFIQRTLKQSQNDHDQMLLRQQAEVEEQHRKLGLLFKRLDSSGDGQVRWSEFHSALRDPITRAWLHALEIDVGDLETVFKLLDDGDGKIDVDEFIENMSKVQGPARSFDVLQVLNLSKSIHKMLALPAIAPPSRSPRFGNAEVQSLGPQARNIRRI